MFIVVLGYKGSFMSIKYNYRLYVGKTYNRLTIISYLGRYNKYKIFLCKCSCGNIRVVKAHSVINNKIKSCGCLQKEKQKLCNTTHGKYNTPIYNTWGHLLQRCHNQNNDRFYDYGGRGIFVCRRWRKSFENFYKDMGRRPTKEHSIDRIDNNYGYIPFNCRWATQKEQMNNVRTNHLISFNGETLTLIQWSRKTGINRTTIYNRINKLGWTIEKSLTTPVRKNKR